MPGGNPPAPAASAAPPYVDENKLTPEQYGSIKQAIIRMVAEGAFFCRAVVTVTLDFPCTPINDQKLGPCVHTGPRPNGLNGKDSMTITVDGTGPVPNGLTPSIGD